MKKNRLLEYSKFLLVVFGIMAFRSSFADHYHIPSRSMEPTLVPGSRVIVNKLAYDVKLPFTHFTVAKLNDPKRGEIIVFANPKNHSENFIKRVIGLPGDKVVIRDGRLFINGVEEKKLDYKTVSNDINFNASEEYLVPKGAYFVLGDNRANSLDSRSWGFLKRKLIKGKAVYIF